MIEARRADSAPKATKEPEVPRVVRRDLRCVSYKLVAPARGSVLPPELEPGTTGPV